MSDTMNAPPGYCFLRHISEGGFGTVIEVSENSTGEHFAVKMMRCMSSKDKERIDREVHRLRTFVHPHIVGLKEVVKMENAQAIVMELGGQSLAQVVKSHSERGELIDRHIVYQVMVDISSALCFMHNHPNERTAHGDVKLENILLFGDGHAKLCDLGAAESEDVSSTRGVMSMQYVSPERLEDAQGRASGSSDVWALGIVLHFLLFGKGLFSGQTMIKLAREIGSFQPSQIGTSCGEKERELLIRMLDPDCGSRLTSKQLVESSILRCLINTTWAGWKLLEMKSRETEMSRVLTGQHILVHSSDHLIRRNKHYMDGRIKNRRISRILIRSLEMRVGDLEDTLQSSQATVAELTTDKRTLQDQLRKEKAALKKEEKRNVELQNELKKMQKEKEESEKERIELKRKIEELEAAMQGAQPKAKDRKNEETRGTEQRIDRQRAERTGVQVERSRKGAAAIEWFPADGYSLSGSVFTRTGGHYPHLLSFSFGKVIARFTFTIRRITDWTYIGYVASSQTEEVKDGRSFSSLLGGAGWDVFEEFRSARQNGTYYSSGSACAAGSDGQRVVLEADGRDGKRTLRLSQDGQTQPTFFSNIPVPFRFAIHLSRRDDSNRQHILASPLSQISTSFHRNTESSLDTCTPFVKIPNFPNPTDETLSTIGSAVTNPQPISLSRLRSQCLSDLLQLLHWSSYRKYNLSSLRINQLLHPSPATLSVNHQKSPANSHKTDPLVSVHDPSCVSSHPINPVPPRLHFCTSLRSKLFNRTTLEENVSYFYILTS
ncbi:putative CBL-interacting protein kinase 31 [Blattamonas nauphoetae]|uniref:non-specific serine/threonine protein kinase n=1 Tax=Blattamonas nauphoetae TaxID=2049346 RepID=A0ABQ9Y7G4_9EUKA|nr:putative CBL-interacting protein kinase 31 [Blattamonas nauphoetae]